MPSPNIRLLIIDDEEDVLAVMKESAAHHGFTVSLASSVAAAIDLLNSGVVVDVVLCDVTMPDGGAERWLRDCWKLDPTLVSRTIVVSGWLAPDAGSLVDGITPENCLLKPFSMSDVRRTATRMLGW